jgi:dihydrofolate reductase
MARLLATMICTADLYTVDAEGRFDWGEPSEQVHAFINDLERGIGTYLYGSRMYDTMRFWETMADEQSVMGDYGRVWRAAQKVVYSSGLEAVSTARTRLERHFDPVAVAALKADADADLSIGGATLIASALLAGLVDELRLVLVPVVVGGGTPALPLGLHAALRLLETRAFENGWVYLRYGLDPGSVAAAP